MDEIKVYETNDEQMKMMKNLEEVLMKCAFATSGNRRMLTTSFNRPSSMPIGMKKELSGQYSACAFDNNYPEIYPMVRDIVNSVCPDFDFNAGYINKNVQMIPHKDRNNVDTSIIFGLGNYTGGEVNVEGEKIDIHYKIVEFDGKRKLHWTEFFIPDRFSIILYKI